MTFLVPVLNWKAICLCLFLLWDLIFCKCLKMALKDLINHLQTNWSLYTILMVRDKSQKQYLATRFKMMCLSSLVELDARSEPQSLVLHFCVPAFSERDGQGICCFSLVLCYLPGIYLKLNKHGDSLTLLFRWQNGHSYLVEPCHSKEEKQLVKEETAAASHTCGWQWGALAALSWGELVVPLLALVFGNWGWVAVL